MFLRNPGWEGKAPGTELVMATSKDGMGSLCVSSSESSQNQLKLRSGPLDADLDLLEFWFPVREEGRLSQPSRNLLSLSARNCHQPTWVQPVSDSSGLHSPCCSQPRGHPIIQHLAYLQGTSLVESQGTDSSIRKGLEDVGEVDAHGAGKTRCPGGHIVAQIPWSVSQKVQPLYRCVIQSRIIGRKLLEGNPILDPALKQNDS